MFSTENEVDGREVSLPEASRPRRKDQSEIRGYKEPASRYIHEATTATAIHGPQDGDRTAVLRIRVTQSGYVVWDVQGRGATAPPSPGLRAMENRELSHPIRKQIDAEGALGPN